MKTVLLTFALVSFSMGNAVFSQMETNLLNSSGNIGIGTTTPTCKLSVRGNVRIDSTLTVQDSLLVKKDLRVMEGLNVNGNTNFKGTATVSSKLRVNGLTELESNTRISGKLKLSSVAPQHNLNQASLLLLGQDDVVQKAGIENLASALYGIQCQDEGLDTHPVWSNGPLKIYVDCPTNTKVGIGTFSPRSKLDVSGTTTTDQLAIGVHPDMMVGKFHLKVATASANPLLLVENPTRKLMQLDGQGLLKVREVRVDLVSWPDYVFKPGYKLMPLHEVEAFIRQKGHLPNVPNASIVESEGLDLGEMNKILMEKTEELTLYLIDQEKRMQLQELKINQLQAQLANQH